MKEPSDGSEPESPKVIIKKRGFGTWHLTGFSGVRASFRMDVNGTLDSTHLFNPNKGLPVKRILKIP
jgi:hypothetical protein